MLYKILPALDRGVLSNYLRHQNLIPILTMNTATSPLHHLSSPHRDNPSSSIT